MLQGKLVGTVEQGRRHQGRGPGDDHHGQEARRGHRSRRSSSSRLTPVPSRRLTRARRPPTPQPPERRRERRIQLAIARVQLGVALDLRTRAPRPASRRTTASAAASTVGNQPAPTAASSAGAVRRALGGADRRDLGLQHVGEDLAPQRAGGAAARGADLGRRRHPGGRSSGRGRRAARTPRPRGRRGSRCRRSWASVRPDERAAGERVGVRAALARQVGQEQQPVAAGRRPAAASSTSSPNGTPGATASRNQRRLPAAESITDIMCHRPGTAWQNAWTRPAGSNSGPSVVANTTPEVPSDSATRPGTTAPDPDRVGRLVAAARHHRRPGAQAGRLGAPPRRPRRSPPAPRTWAASTPGRCPARRASPATSRARRGRTAASRSRPPCPARTRRSAGSGRSPWAAARGRRAPRPPARAPRTQASLGAVNPVSASLPVISTRRCGPTAARIASHSAAVRWSFHRIAGRRTSPAASSRTSPCICPVRPTPSTSSAATPAGVERRAGSPRSRRSTTGAGPARSTAGAAGRTRRRRRRSPGRPRTGRGRPPWSRWSRRRSRGRRPSVRPGPPGRPPRSAG